MPDETPTAPAADAASAPDAAHDEAEALAWAWFNDAVAGSPATRWAEATNYLTQIALPALIARLAERFAKKG
jgi:hypothetical protein